MRMSEPRELFNAQGFPADYIIDIDCNEKNIQSRRRLLGMEMLYRRHLLKRYSRRIYRNFARKLSRRQQVDS